MVARVARFYDANTSGPTGAVSSVLLMADVDQPRLAGAVLRPFSAFAEVIGQEDRLGKHFPATVANGGLYFWLTTGTAFQLATTQLFCDGLESRGVLTAERRPDVELVLHEALANALLHGNLGLDSGLRDDFMQYERFCQLLDERLHDPVASQLRVEMAATWTEDLLEVTISDEGDGFTMPNKSGPNKSGPNKSGSSDTDTEGTDADEPSILHGLDIIRALTTGIAASDEGRCITVRFAR
ncbi:MAG: ATP-binding protein [Alphaproteobacteria bacterium]|nr:ATP-binding protein [Alphaproteobacteria bacterium]